MTAAPLQRRRAPGWREDVERERQRRVAVGLSPEIEDLTVLTTIARILRDAEARVREQEADRGRRRPPSAE